MSDDHFEDDDPEQRIRTITFAQVFAFCWAYWRAFPTSLALLLLCMVTVTATSVAQPWFAGQLVDAVSGDPQTRRIPVWLLAGVVGAFAANVFMHQARDRVWIRVACRSMARMCQDAFQQVQGFSTDWHANSFAGATVRKVTRGIWAMDSFGDTLVYGFGPTILVVLGTMWILASIWPLMGLLILVAVLINLVLVYFLSTRYVSPANQAFAAKDSVLSGTLADAITCNPTVKSFGAEEREQAKLADVVADWRVKMARSWNRGVNAYVAQSMVLVLLRAALLGLTLYYWTQGQATPGQITLVLTTILVLDGYLRDMGSHIREMQKALNDMEDIVRFRTQEPGVLDRTGALTFRPGAGRIVFDRVGFGYPNQKLPVYRDFSLDIAPGERIALVGKSGSGKSTFVKLVQRLYDVQSGRILLDGQDLRSVSQKSLRSAIALVPQEPILFHRSLSENIAYGRPDASTAEIEWAARKAHAHDFITGLPQGYGTLVGERGVKLSGGERQRVAIARAFLADAPVLILDEATSSLDSITEEVIQDAIRELMRGRTTILIAHRLSTIQMVDRILVFSDGRVVEQGTHEELMRRPEGQYRLLYETQYGARSRPAHSA